MHIAAQGLKSACCGMIFNTKGFMEAAQSQCNALEQSLLKASDNGNIPIVCDTSPCLGQLKSGLTEKGLRFSLYEPVEFINTFLKDKLEWSQVGPALLASCARCQQVST